MKHSEEKCACGSGELEVWRRQEIGKSRVRGGKIIWFVECLTCGKRGEGPSRKTAVAQVMTEPLESRPDTLTFRIGMEWDELEAQG